MRGQDVPFIGGDDEDYINEDDQRESDVK